MCLIIHRESGSNVPNDILDYNRQSNPDGFGLAWREGKVLKHAKFGPKDYAPFHALLKSIDKQPNIEYVAHYRYATHGEPCENLSHPFVYADDDAGDVAIFHNGVINIRPDKDESDTSQFVKSVLEDMEPRWWKRAANRFLVEQAIGYSRLVVMTDTETVRLNESAWVKRGGIWYSTEPRPQQSRSVMVPAKYPTTITPITSKWLSEIDKTDDDTPIGSWFEDDIEPMDGWMHQGHWVESLSEKGVPGDGEDYTGTATCSECKTVGDYYVIEGQVFIEVDHDASRYDDEDEESGTAYAL